MISGIYKIINKINDKIYIGSSINLKRREREHINKLKKNIHNNPHLQNSWNKYGKENFKFEIIEVVEDEEKLIEREQYYLDTLNPEYNICEVAGSTLGFNHSKNSKEKMSKAARGRVLNEETRKKMSESQTGRKHPEEVKDKIAKGNKGKIISEESKRKMSKAKKGLYKGEKHPNSNLKREDVIRIKIILKNRNLSNVEIASIYGVSSSTISAIKTGRNWGHLKVGDDIES